MKYQGGNCTLSDLLLILSCGGFTGNRVKFAQLFQLANPDWCSVLILISLKTAIKMHPFRKRSNSAFWCFLVGCCYRKKSNNGNEIHKLWPTHKYFYMSWKNDKKVAHLWLMRASDVKQKSSRRCLLCSSVCESYMRSRSDTTEVRDNSGC